MDAAGSWQRDSDRRDVVRPPVSLPLNLKALASIQ